MGDCPSHLLLCRFTSDDLKPAEAEAVSAHTATCEACRALLISMKENVETFESRKAQGLASLVARMDQFPFPDRRHTGRRLFAVGAVVASAAAALFVLVVGLGGPKEQAGGDGIQSSGSFKGTMSLAVTAVRGTEQFTVKNGTRLQAGDRVRFSVTVDRSGYLTVFSVEADGTISPFYPDTSPREAPSPWVLDTPGRHTLPGSIILDDASGEERFFAVFSDRPFDRNTVLKSALVGSRRPDNAGLGAAYSVQSITVVKGD